MVAAEANQPEIIKLCLELNADPMCASFGNVGTSAPAPPPLRCARAPVRPWTRGPVGPRFA